MISFDENKVEVVELTCLYRNSIGPKLGFKRLQQNGSVGLMDLR